MILVVVSPLMIQNFRCMLLACYCLSCGDSNGLKDHQFTRSVPGPNNVTGSCRRHDQIESEAPCLYIDITMYGGLTASVSQYVVFYLSEARRIDTVSHVIVTMQSF